MTEETKKEEDGWKRVIVNTDSPFFPIFQKIVKNSKLQHPYNVATVDIKDWGIYKFEMEWQDENICAVEVLKKC